MIDAFSITIFISCLSLGCLLVYLVKRDFERRQSKAHSIPAFKKTPGKPRKQQQSKATFPATKQVPSVEVSTISTHHQQQTITTSTSLSNVVTKQSISKQQSSGQVPNDGTSGHNVKCSLSQATTKAQNQSVLKSKKADMMNGYSLDKKKEVSTALYQSDGLEPSLDELDSSVQLGVFNPTAVNKSHVKQNGKKSSNSPQSQRNRKNSQQINNSSVLTGHQNFGDVSYSSEQVFNMIAASNLSQEEVEFAIEALLNKIESKESKWKQPKSDPQQRLKNQIRDLETALQIETQNHDHTKARSHELKAQLQIEKSFNSRSNDEQLKLKKELSIVNLALEQARADLSKQQKIQKQIKDESAQIISKLEQDKAQLQTILSNASVKDGSELSKLRHELNEKKGQLQTYELSNQAMSEKIQEIDSKLRSTELQLEQLHSSKQQDEYEVCAKMTELESDRLTLDKALKDHVARLRDLSETNNMLEKSVKELQLINGRQEDMLRRMRDERLVNENSMKRTLCEMEQELKELQTKLSANTASHDEKLRKEMNQVEKELTSADERERKLLSEIKELREGLSTLLPNYIKKKDLEIRGDDWVRHYLVAVKQLATAVEELKEANNNVGNNNPSIESSPSKQSVDKSTLTIQTNGAGRVGSPTSNGRTSKAESHGCDRYDGDKKMMETKLLELSAYVTKLEKEIQALQDTGSTQTGIDERQYQVEQQLKDYKLQKSKLEAQIKFGIDSLKMEQEKVRNLENELSNYKKKVEGTIS